MWRNDCLSRFNRSEHWAAESTVKLAGREKIGRLLGLLSACFREGVICFVALQARRIGPISRCGAVTDQDT